MNGNQTAKNIHGLKILKRNVTGKELSYFYNAHGDVTALLDKNGVLSGRYDYDAFGNLTEETDGHGNPYKYAGYEHDSETGLYNLKARYYSPKTARFVSEDTYRGQKEDPLSLNLYTYCHNEPVRYVDPTGFAPQAEMDNGSVFNYEGLRLIKAEINKSHKETELAVLRKMESNYYYYENMMANPHSVVKMEELALAKRNGLKVNLDEVVATTKMSDGKLVWLEIGIAGEDGVGLLHIMDHADEFVGITDDIPDFLMTALREGNDVGMQNTREIYEVVYKGTKRRVAISVGSNGFIVGANMKSAIN